MVRFVYGGKHAKKCRIHMHTLHLSNMLLNILACQLISVMHMYTFNIIEHHSTSFNIIQHNYQQKLADLKETNSIAVTLKHGRASDDGRSKLLNTAQQRVETAGVEEAVGPTATSPGAKPSATRKQLEWLVVVGWLCGCLVGCLVSQGGLYHVLPQLELLPAWMMRLDYEWDGTTTNSAD